MLIDTNIILELMLEQDNAKDCADFFEGIRNEQFSETVYMTRLSLGAIEAYCRKEKVEFLRNLLLLIYQEKIKIFKTDISDDLMVNTIRVDLGLDFDDAYQFTAAQKLGTYIVTYDKDFQKAPIQTKTPAEVLKTILI